MAFDYDNGRDTLNSTLNERDLTSYVTNISPKESPLYSLLGRTTAVARQKESITDVLQAANKDNALIEGGLLTTVSTSADRGTESNWLQIFSKTIEVSGTQEAVMKYGGITSELAYQIELRYTELATDIEDALINGTGATGTTAAGRKMYGLLAKITTNTATAASANAQWTGTATADLFNFEELLITMLQQGFTTGISFDTILVGGTAKRRISRLSTKLTMNIDAVEKKSVMVISTYESDFGEVSIILDRYVPSTTIIGLKLQMFKVAYLRPFAQEALAKVSDSKLVNVLGELTLAFDTQKAASKLVFQ